MNQETLPAPTERPTTTKAQTVIWPAPPIKDAVLVARKVIEAMFPHDPSENRSAYAWRFSILRKDRAHEGNEEVFIYAGRYDEALGAAARKLATYASERGSPWLTLLQRCQGKNIELEAKKDAQRNATPPAPKTAVTPTSPPRPPSPAQSAKQLRPASASKPLAPRASLAAPMWRSDSHDAIRLDAVGD